MSVFWCLERFSIAVRGAQRHESWVLLNQGPLSCWFVPLFLHFPGEDLGKYCIGDRIGGDGREEGNYSLGFRI